MFPTLPERARKLNATLVKCWTEGVNADMIGVASDILNVARIVPVDAGEGVYLFPQEIRGNRSRGEDGAIVTDAYSTYEASIRNRDRYRVIDVPLNDYKDDKIGQYSGIATMIGKAAAADGPIEIEELFASGDASTALCYDGKPFFATDHPSNPSKSGSAPWANKLVQAGGLTLDNFEAALAAMTKFPSATEGKAVGSRPSHLLVSPSYEGIAIDICKNTHPSGLSGGMNKWLGLNLQYVVVPNWASRDMYVLCDAREELARPVIFQEREETQLVANGINPDDPMVWERGFLRWISKGRNGVGYGLPSKALLSVKS